MDMNELLRAVHSLFSKVALLDLHKRTSSYKQQGSRDIQRDIATPLSECIDRLAASQPARTTTFTPVTKDEPEVTDTTHQEIAQTHTNSSLPTNLSEYLKDHSQHSDSESYIGDKLKASTWTHIHTAILKAREGDAKTAKLHADIANQAMKEAGHYMSDEDYKLFSEEIEKTLNDLRQQSS